MSLTLNYKDTSFGIADVIRVTQKIKEGDKARTQVFEGIVIAIKNRDEGKSFTVRKIGAAGVGVERIFPLISPNIDNIEVVKKGTSGAKRAKLYYIRKKSQRETEEIYSRAIKKTAKTASKKK